MRLVFLAFLLSTAACRSGAQSVEGAPTAAPAGREIDHLYRSALSGLKDSLLLVVRDSMSLIDIWTRVRARHVVAGPPPIVDFDQTTIVVAALGERPSTNFWIAVDSTFVREGRRIVSVTRFTVEGDCSGGQMLTSPVELAAIPNDGLPLEFVERTRVLPHCAGGRPGPPPDIP